MRIANSLLSALLAILPQLSPGRMPAAGLADSLLAPGISLALARHRAATIRAVRYGLTLDVTSLDSATGQVTVQFQRSGTGDAILDFRGRRLGAALANGTVLRPSAIRDGHILVPARLLHDGENTLRLEFVADIAPTGASIIRNHDPTDGSDYLYTLLVPADASQLFPCFDQPDLKARVRLTLTAPAAWSVVSNGPDRLGAAGRRRHDHHVRRDPADQHLSDRLRGRAVAKRDAHQRRTHASLPTCAARARRRPTSTPCSR